MALIVYEHIERDPVRILFIRRVLDCNRYIPIKYKKQVKLYHKLYICVFFIRYPILKISTDRIFLILT